jgi:ABC-2 type transport system ATP-binding protein
MDQVDLEIRPGETFGLLGPNRAGKTTTIRMITTLLKPASGRVTIFGVDAAARPMLVRRMIGYVPQRRRRSSAERGRGHRVLSMHRADGGTARRDAAA